MNDEKSGIDIIIPIYNQSRKIGPCLESIFAQTYNTFRIIVVDDGSVDSLKQYLDPYRDKLTYIYQKHCGASMARNRGAADANSKYLLFCDADIILRPYCLEKMIRALENNPEASYAYSDFVFGFKTFHLFDFDEEKLKKLPYIHTTSLMRKQSFCGFDPNIRRFQDWDLWLTLLEKGHKGIWIPEILFHVGSGGTMSKWFPSLFLKYFTFLPRVKEYNFYRGIVLNKHKL